MSLRATSPVQHTEAGDRSRQEREVRLTAQRILTRHLRPLDQLHEPADTYWSEMDLDLTGATLINVDLQKCKIHTGTFTGARFTGRARFKRTEVTHTSFDGASFSEDAWFAGVRFTGDAWFNRAWFTGHAWFTGTRFTDSARFDGVQFVGDAQFAEVRFAGPVQFANARFAGPARFDDAQFAGPAWFDGAQFTDHPGFGQVVFAQGVPASLKPLLSAATDPSANQANADTAPAARPSVQRQAE